MSFMYDIYAQQGLALYIKVSFYYDKYVLVGSNDGCAEAPYCICAYGTRLARLS